MAIRQNQGFLKDFNLQETESAAVAINVLGGGGISDDLLILRNNLRNTSTLAYESVSDGFFFFGNDSNFVYTNDDVVTVSTNVTVAVGSTLTAGTDYYVCNSDGLTKFKLSTTSSTTGISTINVTSASPTSFNFIRRDPVHQENLINFIEPEIQDTSSFNYLDNLSVNNAITETQERTELTNISITQKYKTNADTTTTKDINIDGVVTISDPTGYNNSSTQLTTSISPGLFIGTTRAFSFDNGPWEKVGTALSTSSSSVSIGELYFNDAITITGISTESATSVTVTNFTHKIPVTINNETYYLLLRT